jgi:hypothetical protein
MLGSKEEEEKKQTEGERSIYREEINKHKHANALGETNNM